ncbi:acetylglutamate kinase [Halobacteriales archaeon SW_8_68_21]|nr:MAG: acetylglutamate kinase [Halobacteriales archaeon SW_8_68_21]
MTGDGSAGERGEDGAAVAATADEPVDPPVVLKLGGSLITEKGRPETLDGAALDAACDAVADALAGRGDIVVVHGGGSFGHHHASERGVSTTEGTRDADAAAAVHAAMKRLNAHVLERLRERGVPAVPVHPLSLAARADGAAGGLALPLGSTATLLGEGFVPVLHGDGVATAGDGVTVVSGDELVVDLATGLGARRVGVCSTVPGVLDSDGDVIRKVDAFAAVADALGASDATDVSGGMAAKVRELLGLDAPAYVFGGDGLVPFLRGEDAGTKID